MESIVVWAFLSIYALSIPCTFIHSWIIVSSVCYRKESANVNLFEANLSFAALVAQIFLVLFIVTSEFGIWQQPLCGTRSYLATVPYGIIIYTLVRMAKEEVNLTRRLVQVDYCRQAKSILVIDLMAFLFCMPIIYSRRYDSTSLLESKCVKKFFLDDEIIDWTFRLSLLTSYTVVPILFLVKAVRQIKTHMDELNSPIFETVTLADSQFARQKYQLMKNAKLFIIIFVCYFAPVCCVELLDSPAIIISSELRHIKNTVRDSLHILGYAIINVLPIAIYYKKKNLICK